MDTKSKIILISGPTASGKSDFAIKLAKKINGEIINADSMQVYKELKILTARPSKKEQKNIKHHLYGIVNVKKNFSTGLWLKLAIKKIREIQKKNKVPILVGGTGLYFRALTEGFVKIPNIPLKVRMESRLLHKKLGQKSFYKKLIKIDPLCKTKINKNDSQRSIRAYEIKKNTNISLFVWYKNTKKIFKIDQFKMIYIDFPKDHLIKRINLRVEKMFKKGAIREVGKFLNIKLNRDNSSNKVIGINEISNYLDKSVNLLVTKERIAIKTRQYAKRQRTWARGQMKNWQKVDPEKLKTELKNLQNYFS